MKVFNVGYEYNAAIGKWWGEAVFSDGKGYTFGADRRGRVIFHTMIQKQETSKQELRIWQSPQHAKAIRAHFGISEPK